MNSRILFISVFISILPLQFLYSKTLQENSLKKSELQDSSSESKFSEAIEDNSFLIEEAYNQEDRVIQHISTLIYSMKPFNSYSYSFTQEWPFFSQKHQLSFTIPYTYFTENSVSGIGDIYLNYRYQLTGHDDFITAAPRISVILPTGNNEKGLGTGSTGFQLNIPLSKRLTEGFAAHANLGMTLFPNAKANDISGREIKKTLASYNYGASIIWLLSYNFNLMLEYVGYYNGAFDEKAEVGHRLTHILSPGLRYAIDVNKLQIVPGIALPVSFEEGSSRTDLFFYLSFEHPI